MFMSIKPATDLAGEYYLRNVPELASGFRLDHEQQFQFFLSYGALDRYGSGKWASSGNQISFHSKPWSGKDFALHKVEPKSGDLITIRITDNNENILQYVAASLSKGEQGSWVTADAKGFIFFPKQQWNSIALISEFSAERVSVFNIDATAGNYFEFRFEPWIMEYFFTDFRLTITGEGFYGRHPMLQGDSYVYRKRVNKL